MNTDFTISNRLWWRFLLPLGWPWPWPWIKVTRWPRRKERDHVPHVTRAHPHIGLFVLLTVSIWCRILLIRFIVLELPAKWRHHVSAVRGRHCRFRFRFLRMPADEGSDASSVESLAGGNCWPILSVRFPRIVILRETSWRNNEEVLVVVTRTSRTDIVTVGWTWCSIRFWTRRCVTPSRDNRWQLYNPHGYLKPRWFYPWFNILHG